jgi:hypothetical protein
VRPKDRYLRIVIAIIFIVGVPLGLVWFVWRSPHRTDLATFWAFVAAVAVPAVSLIVYVARHQSSDDRAPVLDDVTDLLAAAVADHWRRAAQERGLLYPEPIPVRWKTPSRSLTGSLSVATESHQFSSLPGLPAVTPEQLQAGQVQDLHRVYGGLGSGRLMIVGAAGSGKSGAGVLLVLAALKHREQVHEQRRLVPVPVMFTLHGWDPNTQRVQDRLVAQLGQIYPLFAGKVGQAQAASLVAAGRIAVILDGLDEMPDELRPVALRALSEQANFRVVVLSRSTEMADAVTHGFLAGAAAIELQDVDPATAADYLTRVQRDPPPEGWRELTDHLRHTPHSPIATALSSPLILTLIRDTHLGCDDVRQLLRVCDTGHGASREDIEDHLLDRVLPAAYARRPGEPAPPYELRTARRALSYIAARMSQDGTRDLAWWRIPLWTSSSRRQLTTGLIVGPASGLAYGLSLGWLGGKPGAGFVVGPMLGLIAGYSFGSELGAGGRSPQSTTYRWWRNVLTRNSLVPGFVVGLMLFPLAFLVQARGGESLTDRLTSGLILISAVPLVFAVLFALYEPPRPTRHNTSPLSPLDSWRRERIAGLTTGPVFGLLFGAILGGITGGESGLVPGLLAGLVGWFVMGLGFALIDPQTWPATLAFTQLALSWHTPIHLMRFLEDARGRSVLRTVGPVYQFRHARLQDRLAVQATPEMTLSGQRRPSSSSSERMAR